ncbi:MAG TPA: DNA topology modulation protein [Clostridia bacterium]
MKKIMIIGSGGAGKSTLARELGKILKIEVFHLDSIHWNPGWVETPFSEWKMIIDTLVKKEEWIIDGNYGDSTMKTRLQAADTIIFMDLPRVVCLFRIIKRRIQNIGKVRPDMGKGCPEKIDWSFIKWIWTYPESKRPEILNKIKKYSEGKKVILLHNSKEVNQFIKRLEY